MTAARPISLRPVTCRRCGRRYGLPRPIPALAACPACGAAPVRRRPQLGRLRHNGLAAVLALAAVVVLAFGVSVPFVSMEQLGRERIFSLVGGVAELYRRGDVALAVVLGTFSVVFPFAKLLAILVATSRLAPMSARGRRILHKAAVLTGKYSLLDLLVVAVMIVLVKFDGLAEVAARPGTGLFLAAVLLSIASGLFVDLRPKMPTAGAA